MSEQLSPSPDNSDSNRPYQSFPSWLKSQTALMISQFFGIASVVYVFAALVYYLEHFEEGPEIFDPKNIQIVILYVHLPFVLLFIGTLVNILNSNPPGASRCQTVYKRVYAATVMRGELRKGRVQLQKFKKYFLGFWIVMLIFYIAFILQIHFQSDYELKDKEKIITAIKDANTSTDITQVLARIQSVQELTKTPEIIGIVNKLKASKNQKNVGMAIETIREIDAQSVPARIVGNLGMRNNELAVIQGQIRDIDGSEKMQANLRRIDEMVQTQELPKIIKQITETPFLVADIRSDSRTNALIELAGKIQENSNLRKSLIDGELQALNEQTKKANELLDKPQSIAQDWVGAMDYLKYQFVVFAGNNFTALLIFWCFTVMAVPWHAKKSSQAEKRLRLNGTFVISVITISYPFLLSFCSLKGEYYDYRLLTFVSFANAVSGIINAIVYTLLITRFVSKFNGLRSYLVTILFGYAAIQPLFVVFEQPGEEFQIIKALVLVTGFVFKIHFFLIITYVLHTGRMLDYLVCFPVLARRVDSILANPFSIEICGEKKDYRFLIRNRKNMVYKSESRFTTREKCEEAVEKLLVVMKEKLSYRINFSHRLHWVEVFDSANERIALSTDLKSEEEAKDLIADSMLNIPYCKVAHP